MKKEMKISQNQIVGQLVAHDYRTAAVFKKYGIDFCCQGNRTIADAVENRKMNIQAVLDDLQLAVEAKEPITDFNSWPLDFLVDYIENEHHRYVEEKSSEIKPYLNKICHVHGDHHPELFEIQKQFNTAVGELTVHMKKEEFILFPFIRKLSKAKHEGRQIDAPPFGTIQNPIAMMNQEHETEGDRFQQIDQLSNNYTPPDDACNTYRVTFALLREFEQDLHMHIHLENNILFPQSIELEKQVMESRIV